MSVVFRDEAISDLDEIARFIGQNNPTAAARVIARIHRVIHRTIDRFPHSGRLNPANNTREFAVPGLPYLIIYLPAGDVVDIIAIFHTSRDPSTSRVVVARWRRRGQTRCFGRPASSKRES